MTNCSEMPFKFFRFTYFPKNASANHLESHSCKNKGLKVPCFHTLTKKGVGEGGPSGECCHPERARDSAGRRGIAMFRGSRTTIRESRVTSHESRVTSPKSTNINTYEKCVCNSFNINTYKNKGLKVLYHQHLQKRGGAGTEFRVSCFECRLSPGPSH